MKRKQPGEAPGYLKGDKHPLFGIPRSPETIEKMRKARLGKKPTQEALAKMANIGKLKRLDKLSQMSDQEKHDIGYCSVEGCPDIIVARKLCTTHYRKRLKESKKNATTQLLWKAERKRPDLVAMNKRRAKIKR